MKKVLTIILIIAIITTLTAYQASALAESGLSYTISDENVAIAKVDSSVVNSFIIPYQFEDKYVTAVGDNAFNGSGISNVLISYTVKSIGDFAFSYSLKLKYVAISSGLQSIGMGAFSGCYQLSKFYVAQANDYFSAIDGVLYSKDSTQLICYPPAKSNKEYTLKEGTSSIVEYGFYKCENLTKVTLPNTLKEIKANAFKNCTKLNEVYFPENIETIEKGAFDNCSSNLKLYGYKGSPVESYALQNDIEFVAIN